MSVAVIDLETTTYTSFKKKANPFDERNYIVMAGALIAGEEWGKAYYSESKEEASKQTWFVELLESGVKLLAGHNIKFDIHHLIQLQHNYDAYRKWVADGGMIFDTQLAEYLIQGMGQQDQYLSLDEVAPRYGGNLKVDEVKALWESGVDTADIDEGLLHRYLIGDPETGDQGDLGNTLLAFKGQITRARKAKQLKSILMNMGSLVYTIEAEHNGMAVDAELGNTLAAELEDKLAALTAELVKFVPNDLPFEFKWTSRQQLSALIFGGSVKYKARAPILDDKGQPTYKQKDVTNYEKADGTFIEQDEYHQLAEVDRPEIVRFKSGKKAGEPKTKKIKVDDLNEPKTRIEEFSFRLPGFTKPSEKWATKTPGVYSVSGDVIEALGNRGIPFLDTLSAHALVSKDLNTYFITTDQKTGEKKGMLTLVNEGIIHHSLNHVNTVTGRFSSSNPSLQNLSGKGKSKVKYLFVSRYPKGKVIQSDFTSLEIYIQAILTKCPQLIADLKGGLDMHCLRVSQTFGIPYEEALLKCKGNDDVEPIPEWVVKRTAAKTFSFQRAYGAGVATIAEQTGLSQDIIQALADAEEERYPEISAYFRRITETIENNTQLTGVRVPHPDFPSKIVELGRGFHRTPDGKLYSWRQNCAPKYIVERSGKWASYSPPEIQNYECQGMGAEWMKAAMWLMVVEFYRRDNWGGLACIVNTVHDASYTDADSSVAVEVAAVQHTCMTLATRMMVEYFPAWDIPVQVPSDTTWGDSMAEDNRIPGLDNKVREVQDDVTKTMHLILGSKK